jgi:hypothetical protein
VQIEELVSLCGAEGRREEDRAKEGTKLNMERRRVLDDLRVRFYSLFMARGLGFRF